MTTTAILTPARRRALEVMAATHPRPARVSNTTVRPAADWLVDEGLARVNDSGGLVLTSAGVIACRAAGIEVRS